MSTVDDRLAELGISLPDPVGAAALYSPVVIDGGVAYTSGIVAIVDGQLAHLGCLGDDLSVDDGRASARAAMLNVLANLRAAVGELERVDRFLRIIGYVRAVPSFADAPTVMDGASEVVRDLWGADRLPVRSAVGVAALPFGASVEIDTIVKLR